MSSKIDVAELEKIKYTVSYVDFDAKQARRSIAPLDTNSGRLWQRCVRRVFFFFSVAPSAMFVFRGENLFRTNI